MGLVKISVEDRLLVHELLARYAHAVDLGDADTYGETFAEDGTLRITFNNNELKGIDGGRWTGRKVIRDYMADTWIDTKLLYHQLHFNTNIVIVDAGADWCNVQSYSMIAENISDEQQIVRHLGLYKDICVKIDGQWYFKDRSYTEWVPADKKQFWF